MLTRLKLDFNWRRSSMGSPLVHTTPFHQVELGDMAKNITSIVFSIHFDYIIIKYHIDIYNNVKILPV